jgi:hypothetical protein
VPDEPEEDLFRFLEEHIDSVYQLEVLLFLRTMPDRDWTVQAVAEQLHLGSESVHAALDRLCRSGLLERGENSRFCFSVQKEELFRVVDRLARAYSDYRVRIINFIHSSERDRDDRGE